MNEPTKKVAYVLAYRAPSYIRTLNILEALDNMKNLKVYTAINKHTGFIRYIECVMKLIWLRVRFRPAYYILGFRGHEIYWIVRLITFGRPLIFDSLMSPYGALKEENKMGQIGSLVSGLVYAIEKAVLKNCKLVLTDTANHVDYFSKTFNIDKAKLLAIPVAAQEKVPSPTKDKSPFGKPDTLNILFYGSFLPLHGVPLILEAAEKLKDFPIHFHFIGGSGKALRTFNELLTQYALANVTHENWVAYEDLLRNYIHYADLCLGGPFGNTPQSQRVITGKSAQCLSQAKATVIGRIDTDCPFQNKVNCLLVNQGDAVSLRQTLLWACENKDQLNKIGKAGQTLYQQYLSVKCIHDKLKKALP